MASIEHITCPTDDPAPDPEMVERWMNEQAIGRELMARIREGCEIRVQYKPEERKAWLSVSDPAGPAGEPCAIEGRCAGTQCFSMDAPDADEQVLEMLRSFAPETSA